MIRPITRSPTESLTGKGLRFSLQDELSAISSQCVREPTGIEGLYMLPHLARTTFDGRSNGRLTQIARRHGTTFRKIKMCAAKSHRMRS